jgi:hypothetical protein
MILTYLKGLDVEIYLCIVWATLLIVILANSKPFYEILEALSAGS